MYGFNPCFLIHASTDTVDCYPDFPPSFAIWPVICYMITQYGPKPMGKMSLLYKILSKFQQT